MECDRRAFLATAAAVGTVVALGNVGGLLAQDAASDASLGERPRETRKGDMLYRQLGKTGEMVSIIGMGGYHIGTLPDEQACSRFIRQGVDRGITFMDNCWDYHDGKSEIWMGRALRDGYRDKVFLMSKIDGQTKKEATKQIDESLLRLNTDHIDLLQHHEVIRASDPDVILGESGACEAMLAAKKAGKIRFVGFTGHKDPFIHLRMIQLAQERNYPLDAVQMPLNVMDAHFRSFGKQVLPEARKQGLGILGMKSMAAGDILKAKVCTATECLHYAMTLPTSVVITGIDKPEILEQALDAAKTFKPLNQQQIADLLSRTQKVAMAGQYEKFKTGMRFDGTIKHPEWLGREQINESA